MRLLIVPVGLAVLIAAFYLLQVNSKEEGTLSQGHDFSVDNHPAHQPTGPKLLSVDTAGGRGQRTDIGEGDPTTKIAPSEERLRIISGDVTVSGAPLAVGFATVRDTESLATRETHIENGSFLLHLPPDEFNGSHVSLVIGDGYGDLFRGTVPVKRGLHVEVSETSPRKSSGSIIIPGLIARNQWFARISSHRGGGQVGVACSEFVYGEEAVVTVHEFEKGAGDLGDSIDLVATAIDRPGHSYGHYSFQSYVEFSSALTDGIVLETFAASFDLGSVNQSQLRSMLLASVECNSARYVCNCDQPVVTCRLPLGLYVVEAMMQDGGRFIGSAEFDGSPMAQVEWLHDRFGENTIDVSISVADARGEPVVGYSLIAESSGTRTIAAAAHSCFGQSPTDNDGNVVFNDMFLSEYDIYIYGVDGPNTREHLSRIDVAAFDAFSLSWNRRPSVQLRVSYPLDAKDAVHHSGSLDCWISKDELGSVVSWQKVDVWRTNESGKIYITAPIGSENLLCAVRQGQFSGISRGTRSGLDVELEEDAPAIVKIAPASLHFRATGGAASCTSIASQTSLPWTFQSLGPSDLIEIHAPSTLFPIMLRLESPPHGEWAPIHFEIGSPGDEGILHR